MKEFKMREFLGNVLTGVLIVGGALILAITATQGNDETTDEKQLFNEALKAAKEGKVAVSKVYLSELEGHRKERIERYIRR